MSHPLRRIRNAAATLASRAREIRVPGLTVWTDAQDRAAVEIHERVSRAAKIADDIEAMLADGVIDESEAARLRLHRKSLTRISEAVAL